MARAMDTHSGAYEYTWMSQKRRSDQLWMSDSEGEECLVPVGENLFEMLDSLFWVEFELDGAGRATHYLAHQGEIVLAYQRWGPERVVIGQTTEDSVQTNQGSL